MCWFTPKIARLIKVWRRYWDAMRCDPTDFTRERYYHFVKITDEAIRSAKRQYELKLANRQRGSLKTLFKYVNSKLQIHQHIPPFRNIDAQIVTFDSGKAELLNQQFESVFTTDNNLIPNVPLKTFDHLSSVNFDEESVQKCILKLRPDSACGPDSISPLFLHRTADILCNPLCKLFKKSLHTGNLPELWKLANIIPIYKSKGSVSDPSNYRPISLTSVVVKCFEMIIHSAMLNFLSERNLISLNQHGFLKKRSTMTQLLLSVNDWVNLIDKRKNVWIEAFLCNRLQRVVVNGFYSTPTLVRSGVPQGTTWSFVIYPVH